MYYVINYFYINYCDIIKATYMLVFALFIGFSSFWYVIL